MVSVGRLGYIFLDCDVAVWCNDLINKILSHKKVSGK